MKIAISTTGSNLDDKVDMRFGRCKGFIIYDTETQSTTYLDNEQNLNAAQGAGIQAAMSVVNADATALITGHIGPKAFDALSRAKVVVYLGSELSVQEVLRLYEEGKLERALDADKEGRW